MTKEAYPLTPLQEGMLFHHIVDSESTGYVFQQIFTFEGDISEERFVQALNLLGMRHDALRTVFLQEKMANPKQTISTEKSLESEVFDLRGLDVAEQEQKLAEIADSDVKRGFDFQRDYLFRAKFVFLRDDCCKMILSYHHIIMDGWSLAVILKDFVRYMSLLRHVESTSEAERIVLEEKHQTAEYSEYVQWLEKQDKERGLSYWRDLLADYEETAELKPMRKPEPTDVQMSKVATQLSHGVTERLIKFAQTHEISIATITEAAWALVLQQYNRSRDVVFGKVLPGRPAEIEGSQTIVGLFIHTIPARIRSTDEMTILELLAAVKQQEQASHEHSYCSLAEVQALSKQKGDLIKTLFAFEAYNAFREQMQEHAEGFRIAFSSERKQTNYAMGATASLDGGALTFNLIYNPNVYNDDDIQSLLARLETIFQTMAENPEAKLSEIEASTEQERAQILGSFNETALDYDKKQTVVDLLEEQVSTHPDRIAVVYQEEQLTFAQLNSRVNQVASKLRELGVKPDDRVALMTERSLEMIIGIYGIIKAGGAYVPIDPTFPEDRIRYILEDAKPQAVLLYQAELETELPVLDLADGTICQSSSENPEKVNKPEDLAYVIYTSGTTGQPKGVMLQHQGVVAMRAYLKELFQVTEQDNVLQFANYVFDATVWELALGLLNGARMTLMPKELTSDVDQFNALVNESGVTLATLPPQFYLQTDLTSLRVLITAGSASNPEVVEKASARYRYVNAYGPTEITVGCTAWEYDGMSDISGNIPIGRPLPNVKAYIMNDMNLCGIGIPGELCIAGDGVARGYLNKPELTAEKFIANPYGDGKLYRTGDLARWLPDGTIEYLGRIDEQVKVRGFRIELGEIENALRNIDNVNDAAVIAKQDAAGDMALYAYLVADEEVNLATIREILGRSLPGYMIPPHMMQIERLPFTRNGKLDKAALPEFDTSSEQEYVAPRSETEAVLCQTFGEVLGVPQVSVTDNFFELGGDSIKAIRIVSKVRNAGYEISVKEIMDKKVVEAIAFVVTTSTDENTYEQNEVTGRVLPTPMLEEFEAWKLAKPHHFNQDIMLEIDNDQVEQIQTVLDALCIHHDAIRSVYKDGVLEMLDSETSKLYEYKVIDLRTETDDVTDQIMVACTEAQASIDLENGPLMKALLFQTADTNHLMVCLHHVVVDGISWRVLIEDFHSAMKQAQAGKPIKLAAKTASFKEWAEALAEYKNSRQLRKEKGYWDTVMAEMQEGRLAVQETTDETGYADVFLTFTEEETEQLVQKAGKAFNTKINDLLLSALGLSVNRLTGQRLVTVGMEGHGREDIHKKIDITRTVGWFTTIYPVVVDCLADVRASIVSTKEKLRQLPNQGLGFGLLKEELGEISTDISFNYLGQMDAESKAAINSAGKRSADENQSFTNIAFSGKITEGKLWFLIKYDKSQFSTETIEKLAALYQSSLVEIIEYCLSQEQSVKTASDYSAAGLTSADLAGLTDRYGGQEEMADIYSLVPLQEGMLYHYLVNSDTTEYFVQNVFEVTARLNEQTIRQALKLLVMKHEVLQTAVAFEKVAVPRQVVLKNREAEFVQVDLSTLSETEQSERVAELAALDVQRGFDLQQDPLIRVTYVLLDETRCTMIWSYHHIIVDGWCGPLIYEDFKRFYHLLDKGTSLSDMEQLVLKEKNQTGSYGEYINWMEKQDKESGLSYWREMLSGYDSVAEIKPMVQPEPSDVQTEQAKVLLAKETSQRLLGLATRHQVTLNTVAEAAWGIVLQQYSHSRDVVFGKVVSGRNAPIRGIENLVGIFINTIPTRVETDEQTTVPQLLANLQKQGADNDQYSYCSLAEIQEVTQLKSDLIKTLFVSENYLDQNEAKNGDDGLQLTLQTAREQTNYAITVISGLEDGVLRFEIMYNPNVFTQHEVQSILAKIEVVLEAFAANPDGKLAAIEAITEQERVQILDEFNDTALDYAKDRTVVDMFEEQVSNHPDRIAVVFQEEQLTFAELNRKVNQVAWKLRELGVRPDDRVAIMAERSLEMIVGIYGIIKAGGAYVPIDPTFPEDRIRFLLEDCQPRAVLLYQAELETVPETERPVLDLADGTIWQGPSDNPDKVNKPDDLAYVIYTSGTTGLPKGVMLQHQGVVAMRAYLKELFQVTEHDNVLQFANYVFDATVWEMALGLLNGARMTLIPKEIVSDIGRFNALVNEGGVTLATLPPQFYLQTDLTSLRALITAGSASNPEVVEKASARYKYVNAYGPTEITVGCTAWEYDGVSDISGNIPIGRPLPNVKAYIMNDMNLCGIGIPGELCIAGDGVARGYLNKPELTAEKFIANPYGDGKLYRTGDLARWLPDGTIEYLGRIDEQVKIRGFRIELGEIENAIRDIDNVNDAAVIAKQDAAGDSELLAYLVADEEIDLSSVREILGRSLPGYMIPAHMMQIERLPFTRNGKLDKAALPEIATDREQEYVAPRSEAEEILCQTFGDVLGVPQISVTANFFELGGHSLRAIRLINQIETKTGYRVMLQEIFAHPTPERLAEHLAGKEIESYAPIEAAAEKDFYPMSSAQKRVYLVSQMGIDGIAYNIPQSFKIKGQANPASIETALQKMIDRHEILRTEFLLIDGEPVQKVNKTARADFAYVAGSETPEAELLRSFVQPFDLSKAPLLRMKLVQRDEESLLMLDMHHIVGDGMSLQTFIREFTALYNGESLEPLTLQYKDYSEWIGKKDFTAPKEYWVNEFSGEIPVLDLPLDYRRPQMQSNKGTIIECTTGQALAEKIKEISRKTDATEYMVFLSAAMILLSKYSRQDDIVVGSLISGRTHKDTENMLGMFVNTLAMRGRPESTKTFAEFLSEMKTKCLNAYDNQEYPFEELVEAVQVRRDMARNPLFDVLLVMQDNEQQEFKLNGTTVEPIKQESTISKFDLKFDIVENDADFCIDLEYCTDLFKEETIKRMLAHFLVVLEQIVENVDLLISEVEAITEEEAALIHQSFNDTDQAFPLDKTVVDLFEEQVAERPDQPAVLFGDELLTRTELNRKANQLARRLRAQGIQPDDRVAIIAQRCPEMIVAILGILKAGGAYVPIDPTYPIERIDYMIDDCRPKAILTARAEVPFATDIPVFDLCAEDIYTGSTENPDKVVTSRHLAYCIYTSGTTGKPKGVMIEHHSLTTNMCYSAQRFLLGDDILVPLFTNYCFDLTVPSIYLPLCFGGTLDLIAKEKEMDIEFIMQNKPYTFIKMTPSQLKTLLDAKNSQPLEKLRCLVVGGELLESSTARSILELYGQHIVFLNEYGPTEATVGSTLYPYSVTDDRTFVPIGKPFANTQIYILNGTKLCGVGVPGELCIAGEQIARGYLNKPEMTAEKFIDNPFGEGKLYRTGDLARWLPDGNIDCLGRIDEQVKVRGFRIELGEISQAIRSIEPIKDTAVIVREDESGDKTILAYYVSDHEVSVSAVREELRKSLPEYMIPLHFMQIDKLPVTPNGKLDRRALPQIVIEGTNEFVAPSTRTEELLCRIFSEILGVETVSVKDSFFELGGDSIKAIRIVSRMRSAGYELSVRDIMGRYIVEAIAQTAVVTLENRYEQGEVTGRVIPTPIIKNFAARNYPNPNHYNQDVILEIDSDEEAEIRTALDALAVHHDIIRSVYREGSLEIVSRDESKLYDFERLDLRDEAEATGRMEAVCNKLHGSIDLEHGPLMKAALFQTQHGNFLFLCLHHLVVDAVSWHILSEDLQTALGQVKEGKTISLPPKTASFKEWAQALEEYKASRQLQQELPYWETVTADMQNGRIALEDDAQETGHADVTVTFTEEQTEQLLRRAGKAFNTEINDLLISAIGLAVNEWTGQAKVTVGLEGHGREDIHKQVDITRTVGWFTIKYPIVVDCREEIRDSIVSTKDMLRQVPAHGLGYGLLQDHLPEIAADLYFNYLGQLDNDAKATLFSSGQSVDEANGISGTLDMNGYIAEGKLRFLIRYDRSRWAAETVERFGELYQRHLTESIAYCSAQEQTVKTASDYAAGDLTSKDLSVLYAEVGESAEVDQIFSLTPLQEGILYHHIAEPESTSYCTQIVYAFNGATDATIQQALKLLVMRHDVLRAAIVHEQLSKPRQVLLHNRDVEYEKVDLTGLSKPEQEQKVAELTDQNLRRGFDLQQDSLLRVKHIVLDETEGKLIWSYHHIVFDGWSSNLMFGDFVEACKQLQNGRSLSELERMVKEEKAQTATYGDYVNWIEKQDQELGLSYWNDLLSDYRESAEIKPLTKPEPTERQMERVGMHLSEETTRQLLQTAASHRITINTVAEAAWGVVLRQYNGIDDVVFGKVVSGRNADVRGIEKIGGLFVNTIPVRVRTAAETTVSDLWKNLQEQGTESDQYGYCSLADIQGLTEQKGDLIKVLYAFDNYYVDEEKQQGEAGGLQIVMESGREQTNYAITLKAFFLGERLVFDVLYNPNHFGLEEVQRLLSRVEAVLQSFAADPAGLVSGIDRITESEQVQILGEFNATTTDYPSDRTVVELLEEQVRRSPEKTAVVLGEEQLTYAELNRKANRLAAKLRDLGVKPDDFVAILTERKIETIVGIYGILKAGGAYVPIDPMYPEDRIRFILDDCRPKAVLISNSELEADLPVLDLTDGTIWEGPSDNPERVNKPTDLAYCMYTSGTTGQPKGSLIEHKSIIRLVIDTNYVELDDTSVILQTGSMSFDASTFEVWGALLQGGKLILADEEVLTNHSVLKEHLLRYEVTTMWLTASLYNLMIQTDAGMFDSLTELLIGGEKLSEEHVRMLKSRRNNVKLINGYGPTENTTFTATYEIPEQFELIPIGRPIANTQVYILNGDKLCGIGIPGELCIAGDGLARGYLNRPELTDEKFKDNPFGAGKLYRSGDLAQWRPDGTIEYLGRIDEQVKIRGFRIELGEIETALLKIEQIRDAAVIARVDEAGDKAICAYLVSDEPIQLSDIRAALNRSLPDYMIPAHMMQIESLPVTRNGKLDRRALPEIEASSDRDYVAPRNDVEATLCRIFSETLGAETVGATDSFFELGGDSIKAIRIVSKMRSEGYSLSVKEIMSRHTVEAIAFAVVTAGGTHYEQGEVTGTVLPTPILEEFASWQLPKPHHFNQDMMLQVELDDEAQIQAVLTALAVHHDIIRSVYRNGRLEILSSSDSDLYDFKAFDLRAEEQASARIEAACTDLQSSIDLEQGPLMKAALFRTAEGNFLFLCLHHLVVDGVSWRILLEDLNTAIKQVKEGQPISFPAKTASFKEWAEALADYKTSRQLARELNYWRQVTALMQEGELALPETGTETGYGIATVQLGSEETDNLIHHASQAFQTEINDLLLSALGMVIQGLTGQSRVTVGLEGHGREDIHKKIDIDRTVGWFTSLYPVVIECREHPQEAIISTKEMLRKVPNRGLGYGVLQQELPALATDIYFNYLGQVDAESKDRKTQFDATGLSVAEENATFRKLNISGGVMQGVLKFTITYDRSKFSADTMERFARMYQEALHAITLYCMSMEEAAATISDTHASDLSEEDLEMINSLFDNE
ncbi:MAG TPA: non-ribosomal peptide synthase/polyketide synthase [Bacilli bacterium]|nr:non-ribosomal peptide synthase/polyketide synthase [Bacilli bacterium]